MDSNLWSARTVGSRGTRPEGELCGKDFPCSLPHAPGCILVLVYAYLDFYPI